jgi:hypothetical protein
MKAISIKACFLKVRDQWASCSRIIGFKGMICVILAFVFGALTLKCAPIGIRTKGESGPVAWEATDLRLVKMTVDSMPVEVYAFTLVLKETQGRGITFTHAKYIVSTLETELSTGESTLDLELRPHGESRLPLSVYIKGGHDAGHDLRPISPAWTIILTGKDDQDAPVRVSININLPSKPPVK